MDETRGLLEEPRRARRWRPVPRPRPRRRTGHARRVEREARSLAAGVRDPAFGRLLHRIDQSPLLGGHRLRVFTDGDAAIASMLAAIDAARDEILLESYILRDDATGRQVLRALLAAARRGVTVRVLVDAVGSVATGSAFWRALADGGVAVRLFHPIAWFWVHIFRDHRKILVVDRRQAFTGGMNLAEEYGSAFGPALRRHLRRPGPRGAPAGGLRAGVWRDSHVRVEGPAAWELAVVFREGWVRAGGGDFPLPRWTERPGDPAAQAGARCLVLDSRPGRGHAETALVLRALVAAARERVWITNSYFAPSHAALAALCRAAARGVDVRLLLPGASDAPLLRHAGHGSYSRLLRHGVRVYEYQASVLHAKTMVVDRHASVVGSSNLDFRSFAFNSECNLVVLDDRVGAELEDAFRTDLERSHEVRPEGWRRRSLRHRLYDRLARWLSPAL